MAAQKRNQKGNRPLFTPEQRAILEQRMVEIIAQGGTFEKAAKEFGCSAALLCKWISDPEATELREQYMRAREAQGDAYADKVIDTAEDPTLDANEKRVRIDAYKWAAGKRKPKVYGDRVTQEHTGPDGGPIKHEIENPLDVLASRLAALAAREEPDGADQQPVE